MLKRRGALVAVLVLAGVPAIIFWPILRGTHTLYPADLLNEVFLPFSVGREGLEVQVTAVSDYLYVFYPFRVFMSESFKAGALPLWNPALMGGHPAFASQGSVATLDPFNALFLLGDLPTALAWRTYLQVVACAAFMYLYLGQLGVSLAARICGGLAFALNSMFWANIFDWSLSSILWLPLVLLFIDRAFERDGFPRAIVAGLVLGVALLSSVLQFYAFHVIAVIGLWLARNVVARRRPAWREAALIGTAILVGVSIASVQLVPTLELITESTRRLTDSGQGVRSLTGMVTGTLALSTFVFPPLAGRLKEGMMLAQAWEGTTHFQGYIGVIGIILAVVGAVCAIRRQALPFVWLALGSLALVLYTPLSIFLYERFFIIYIFSAAVLAAIGVQYLMGSQIDRKRVERVVRVFATFFVLATAAAAIWTAVFALYREPILHRAETYLQSILPGRYLGTQVALHVRKLHSTLEGFTLLNHATLVPLFVAGAAIVTVRSRASGRISSAQFAVAAVVVLAGDLAYSAVSHVPFVNLKANPLFPPAPSIQVMQEDPGLFRTISLRRYSVEPPLLSVGMQAVYGLQTVEGKDNLAPLNFWSSLPRDLTSSGPAPKDFRQLNVENVKYVTVGPRATLPASQFDLIYDGELRVYRNRDVLPRAFIVQSFSRVRDQSEALRMLRGNAFEPSKVVILELDPHLPRPSVEPTVDQTTQITRYEPRLVEIDVRSDQAALLVLSDTYYPGWKADIGGEPTPIMRANAIMRAVAVPGGRHRVTFRYEPLSFVVGALITGTTLALVGCGLLARAVGRLRRSPSFRAAASATQAGIP